MGYNIKSGANVIPTKHDNYVKLTNSQGITIYSRPKSNGFDALHRVADGEIVNSKDYEDKRTLGLAYTTLLEFIEANANQASVELPDKRKFIVKFTPGPRGGYNESTLSKL